MPALQGLTMPIGDVLKDARERKGLTLREAAQAVGIDASSLHRRESGQVRVKLSELPAFASAYDVPVDVLETALRQEPPRRPPPRGIPVINRAHAGHVVNYNHDHYAEGEAHAAFEYLERDANTRGDELFSVIVVGDSMEPSIWDGDYMIFDPVLEGQEDKLRDGSVVFVRFSEMSEQAGGCCIARASWEDEGRTMLLSKDNRRYPSVVVPFDSDHVERIAIAIQRRTKRI